MKPRGVIYELYHSDYSRIEGHNNDDQHSERDGFCKRFLKALRLVKTVKDGVNRSSSPATPMGGPCANLWAACAGSEDHYVSVVCARTVSRHAI
jgi:hypothetical protein